MVHYTEIETETSIQTGVGKGSSLVDTTHITWSFAPECPVDSHMLGLPSYPGPQWGFLLLTYFSTDHTVVIRCDRLSSIVPALKQYPVHYKWLSGVSFSFLMDYSLSISMNCSADYEHLSLQNFCMARSLQPCSASSGNLTVSHSLSSFTHPDYCQINLRSSKWPCVDPDPAFGLGSAHAASGSALTAQSVSWACYSVRRDSVFVRPLLWDASLPLL